MDGGTAGVKCLRSFATERNGRKEGKEMEIASESVRSVFRNRLDLVVLCAFSILVSCGGRGEGVLGSFTRVEVGRLSGWFCAF